MAAQTLPPLPLHSFPQAFAEALGRACGIPAAETHLVRCYFSDEHTPTCKRIATVHYLPNGQEFCSDHFKVVSRG
jgi:hypothetical protein